jgi:hypothetical protein
MSSLGPKKPTMSVLLTKRLILNGYFYSLEKGSDRRQLLQQVEAMEPAVDGYGGTGEIGGVARAQEGDGRRELLVPPDAAQVHVGVELSLTFLASGTARCRR